MKFTFLGHAAGYLETGSDRFLFDPFLTGNPKAAVTADQLNPTYILLTHGHGDHVGDPNKITSHSGSALSDFFRFSISLAGPLHRLSRQQLCVRCPSLLRQAAQKITGYPRAV